MAIHYRTPGFILKKRDLGEADRIFTIFTKDFGKLEILGKAIRKIKSKLRGGAREFCLSEVEFIQGKTYKTLTDASLIENFKNIRNDLKRLGIAFEVSEILDNLVKGQEPDLKIWELLTDLFQRLNNYNLKPTTSNLIYYYFLWNLFSVLGYQPELHCCLICQKKLTPGRLYFSPKEGGITCHNCFQKTNKTMNIDPDIVKILRLLLKKDWPVLNKLKLESWHLKSLKNISNSYLNYFFKK